MIRRAAVRGCVVAGALLAATWVPAARENRIFSLPTTLNSPDAVGRAIASAVADGSDTLQVSLLTQPAETRGGFDAIDEALRQARDRRLRVQGLIAVGLASAKGELPAARDHVVYLHPEWLMVPRDLALELRDMDPRHPGYLGRLLRWTRATGADGLYLSPAYPEAVSWAAAALARTLARYPVDDVTLDLRIPGAEFDFSSRALDLFEASVRQTLSASERQRMDAIEAIDPFAWPGEFPSEWARFQRGHWDTLLVRLRQVAAATAGSR